jgi:hypothetical protein
MSVSRSLARERPLRITLFGPSVEFELDLDIFDRFKGVYYSVIVFSSIGLSSKLIRKAVTESPS